MTYKLIVKATIASSMRGMYLIIGKAEMLIKCLLPSFSVVSNSYRLIAADYKSHCKADQPDIYHHQAVGKWLTYVKSSQYKNCKFRKAVAYLEARIGTTLLKLRQIM